jgi:hypothetical protein
VILGVSVLVWPGISILVAATLFGLYLLITGIAQVIFRVRPGRVGGQPDPGVHQRRRIADPGGAGLSSFR